MHVAMNRVDPVVHYLQMVTWLAVITWHQKTCQRVRRIIKQMKLRWWWVVHQRLVGLHRTGTQHTSVIHWSWITSKGIQQNHSAVSNHLQLHTGEAYACKQIHTQHQIFVIWLKLNNASLLYFYVSVVAKLQMC